jgi:L-rhamnose-H+ transport protein
MNPFLGIFLHAIGGLAAGTFYIPYRKVRGWSWESYWLSQGFVSWIVMPTLIALITAPALWNILAEASTGAMFWSYFFGVLWGIGGLTFGLSMRYLGLSLGMSLSLGFCATFGTMVPPIYATLTHGDPLTLFTTTSGLVVLAGVIVCLLGISTCGYAGILKERELTEEQKKNAIKEFALSKGFAVAVFAGVMSSCFAFGINAGKPIAQKAVELGTTELFCNNPTYIFVMAGGFTTNALWCLFLNKKNRSFGDYRNMKLGKILFTNYALAFIGGAAWYGQFFFYGMGTTQMGKYDFSSWSIHMAFVIIFSNLCGIYFREWQGVGKKTWGVIAAGIAILIFSTAIIGMGNRLAS